MRVLNLPRLTAVFVAAAILVAATPFAHAADPAPRKAEVFEIDGHKAYLYAAAAPAESRPWVWYAPIVKGDVIIARHKVYFDAFMKAGIAVAGFDLGEVRGAPDSTAKFTGLP